MSVRVTERIYLLGPTVMKCVAVYWSKVYLSGAMPLKKTVSDPFRDYQLQIAPSSSGRVKCTVSLSMCGFVWNELAQVLYML